MTTHPVQILTLVDETLRAEGRSEATRCSYLSQVRAWLRWTAHDVPSPWGMQRFIDARAVHHAASADQAVSALQVAAEALGWASVQLRRPRRNDAPEPLTPAQLQRVLLAASDWREDVLLRLLLEGGLSLSELAGLRVEAVLGGTLRLPDGRVLPLGERLRSGLWALVRGQSPRRPVLAGAQGTVSERGLRRMLARIAVRAGVPSLSAGALRRAVLDAPVRRPLAAAAPLALRCAS